MSTLLAKFWSSGALLLVVFASGYIVSRAGKPYPLLGFTVHKLAALAAVLLLGLALRKTGQNSPFQPAQIAAVALAGAALLATIASGGLVSGLKSVPALLLRAHALLPYLSALALALALVLLRSAR